MSNKKRILSGVQPTGDLHIGNWLGAINNWVTLQEQYETFLCVVDLHAITASYNPKELSKNTISTAALYVACGIDPKKIVMITWMIAAILATIGGVLYGLDKSFKPFTYFNNMLPIFAAAIVGGIGNPFGAFLGGYVIAFSEILLTYAYKKFFMYVLPESMEPDGLIQLLSTDYKFAVSFSILVIVLLYRPSGIFKGKIL